MPRIFKNTIQQEEFYELNLRFTVLIFFCNLKEKKKELDTKLKNYEFSL